MKKLKTSDIIEGTRRMMGHKSTLDHLQEAYQEAISELITGLLGTSAGVTVLWGCVDSDPDAIDWNISAGAIYYNGEVFTIPAFNQSHATQVPVLAPIVTAYRAGDPIKFSDNNTFNVHEIRTLVWQLGTGGSGIVDFTAVQRLSTRLRDNVLDLSGKLNDTSDIMTGTLEILGGIRMQNSGQYLKVKVIDIGDWNMDTDWTKSVAHGLTGSKIRDVNVTILSDSGTPAKFDSDKQNIVSESTVLNPNWINTTLLAYDNTNVVMYRHQDSVYNGTSWDQTSYNRGFITIWYEA